jgi:cyclopropane-fatty-acyl-phospholipid synthase
MILRALFLGILARWRIGRLVVRLPGGSERRFGDPAAGTVALHVVDDALYARVLFGGEMGAADAWVAGLWRTDDLPAMLDLFARNLEALELDRGVGRLAQLGAWARHLLRINRRAVAPDNVRAHYDLGNDLYRLFLDEQMIYSCAIWDGEDDLEAAQRRKLDAICDKLGLGPRHHLLDLGCGWGGLALHAARTRGCRVTAVTLAREQARLAGERAAAAGLADRVEVRLCDWRELEGRFDAIACIEMIEAVGDAQLAPFFAACARWLTPGGAMLLQTITIPDERWQEYRRGVDWMQTRIFPGAVIPSPGMLRRALSGALRIDDVEEIGPHYAPTLAAWRARFLAAAPRVRELGHDDRFLRAWELYLAFSQAQFATRRLGDVQMLLSSAHDARRDPPRVPHGLSRASRGVDRGPTGPAQ